MRFRMDQLLGSLSLGLDAVEGEIAGSTTHHSKRIAVLTAKMGSAAGWDESRLITTAACSLLHDNALTESLAETKETGPLIAAHCIKGERNAAYLPFPSKAGGIIHDHRHSFFQPNNSDYHCLGRVSFSSHQCRFSRMV